MNFVKLLERINVIKGMICKDIKFLFKLLDIIINIYILNNVCKSIFIFLKQIINIKNKKKQEKETLKYFIINE